MCEVGYSRTGTFECSTCPSRATNAIRLFFIFLAGLLVIFYLVRSTLNGAKDDKNVTSIYLKILMNHLQLILLTASFNFKWPAQVEELLAAPEPISQMSSQIFSIDCFIDTRDMNSTSETDDSKFAIYYIKLMMMAVLPFLILLASFLIWLLIVRITKQMHNLSARVVASFIIVLFLVHPDIVKYMISIFNCYNVDGEYRVFDNMSIVCYQGNFNLYAFGVGLPGILIWGLGIPLFIYLLLKQVRTKLHLLATKEKYGFLYRGYKKQFYYWESVIMYRKFILVFIQVFVQAYGVITQALVVYMLLIIFLSVNTKKKPFVSLALNDLETYSLMSSMITIYCGLFFISDTQGESSSEASSQLVLSEQVKLVFFFVILLVNLIFFCYWLYKMYQEMKLVFMIKFSTLFAKFCICFDSKKAEQQRK
mmetsp:Transcript_17203/g.12286  ORF Transcript_17203/g.12286 Transcript_17203/m.12286 type:complete len:422 (+) Transcript_17203:512-1777(+)